MVGAVPGFNDTVSKGMLPCLPFGVWMGEGVIGVTFAALEENGSIVTIFPKGEVSIGVLGTLPVVVLLSSSSSSSDDGEAENVN